jgi:hypothetical protein
VNDLIKQWKKYKKEFDYPMYIYNPDSKEARPIEIGRVPSFEDFMDWLAKTGRYTKNLPRL